MPFVKQSPKQSNSLLSSLLSLQKIPSALNWEDEREFLPPEWGGLLLLVAELRARSGKGLFALLLKINKCSKGRDHVL